MRDRIKVRVKGGRKVSDVRERKKGIERLKDIVMMKENYGKAERGN